MTVGPGLHPGQHGTGQQIDAAAWCEQACQTLAGIAGVRGATFARRLPLSGSGGGMTARVEIRFQDKLL
jgi:hypothetical protein